MTNEKTVQVELTVGELEKLIGELVNEIAKLQHRVPPGEWTLVRLQFLRRLDEKLRAAVLLA